MDMQKLVDAFGEIGRRESSRYHLTLGGAIKALESLPPVIGAARPLMERKMPFNSPVIAYHDNRGHLVCASCADQRGKAEAWEPDHADNSALDGDICDCCHGLIPFNRSAREG
jgi:hypothetical protein